MASTPYSNINLPQNVTDPLYTSSQAGLNDIGTKLLSGSTLPGMYSDLGQVDSPQFQAMLNSVKGQIMQGSQESSAINGTARSGVATTASNNALNSVLPQLTYQDFLNSQQQQEGLLTTGIGVQQGVRGAAQNQQQFDTNFNQTLFGDQVSLASLMDNFKKQAAAAQGQLIGNTISGVSNGGILGGVSGYFGGPTDSTSLSNGNAGLSQLFSSLGNINSSSIPNGGNSITSSLGSFGANSLSPSAGTSSIDSLLASGAPLALFG